MRYVLLYYGGAMPETEDEQAAVMAAWDAWFGNLGDALVDGGNPFSGAVSTVAADGATSTGPIGEQATGYSIVEADSLDSATEIAKGCPVKIGGGRIAVYETFNPM